MGFCTSIASADIAIAEISVNPEGSSVLIQGKVLGLDEGQLYGELTVRTSSVSGSSNIGQSRMIDVYRGSKDTIGTVNISLDGGAAIDIKLILKLNGTVIAEASSSIMNP